MPTEEFGGFGGVDLQQLGDDGVEQSSEPGPRTVDRESVPRRAAGEQGTVERCIGKTAGQWLDEDGQLAFWLDVWVATGLMERVDAPPDSTNPSTEVPSELPRLG